MTPRVLYDGWPLAYQPNSPTALHLTSLLAYHPAEFEALVALPAEAALSLPQNVNSHLQPTSAEVGSRLRWEQRILPKLGKSLQADLVHLCGGSPALFGNPNQLLSPTAIDIFAADMPGSRSPASLTTRLRDAMGQGGLARVSGIFWPEDLPAPDVKQQIIRLPRITHPALVSPMNRDSFFEANIREDGPGHNGRLRLADYPEQGIPETFILYHGSLLAKDLQRLFNAWSWAAGSIGEYYPLLIAGVDRTSHQRILPLLKEYQLEASVRLLSPLTLTGLIGLYRECSALFLPVVDSLWQGAIPLAMACGKPIVALETPWSDALIGPAGYLLPGSEQGAESRTLGAALITVVVEENVAEQLSLVARQRAAAWGTAEQARRFSQSLSEAYTLLTFKQTRRQ